FRFYIPVAITMFWCAFVTRIIAAIAFKSTAPSTLSLPIMQMLRRVFLAVTAGSAVIGFLLLLLFSMGRFENLPRSLLLIDWGIMVLFSVLSRLGVTRRAKILAQGAEAHSGLA
ncbi:MAG: hypothetical protein AB1649_34920, partial [Chloroflexota bacterium]